MKHLIPYALFERTNARVVSAKDLLKMGEELEVIEFTYPYNKIFGNPAKNFDMAISGDSGSGKTTFLLKFAYYLATNFGNVLYVSSEEFGSITLIDKLKEIFKDNPEFDIPETLFFGKGLTDFTDYQFVIVDSITDLDVDIMDYKELREIYKNTAFIVVLQYNKAGEYRGSKEWVHEVEIFSDIKDGIISVSKNRYGVYGMYDFFNDKLIVKKKKKK